MDCWGPLQRNYTARMKTVAGKDGMKRTLRKQNCFSFPNIRYTSYKKIEGIIIRALILTVLANYPSVSYTHLTLPTIYSV